MPQKCLRDSCPEYDILSILTQAISQCLNIKYLRQHGNTVFFRQL